MASEKTCTKCGETKPLDGFHRDKGNADGRRGKCKECALDYARRYREENRDELLEYDRRYYKENRDKELDSRRRHYEENRDEWREYQRRYRKENRDYLNLRSKKYHHSYQFTSATLAEKHGQPYTPDEDALLLRDNGMTVYQKAVTLGRAYQACATRIARLRAQEAGDV